MAWSTAVWKGGITADSSKGAQVSQAGHAGCQVCRRWQCKVCVVACLHICIGCRRHDLQRQRLSRMGLPSLISGRPHLMRLAAACR